MDDQNVSGTTRRGLIGRGSFLAALFGLGAGAGATKVAVAEPAAATKTIRLEGRNWLLQTPRRRPGERLVAGDWGSLYGDLVDAKGIAIGKFYGSRAAVQSSLAGPVHADGSLELHTFKLRDGTILGMGSTIDGESIFTITGGTGRYAGSRGTYVATQRLREQGGDGTAEFTIELTI